MADKNLKQPLTPRFDAALALASELHRRQARKGTQIPYISHLLAVVGIALEHGATEDEAIAALLHDAVEDQGGPLTLHTIRSEFGEAVAAIVAACTQATSNPCWRERKAEYISQIPSKSRSARLVSAADKLHNARAILADYRVHEELLWERFNGGRDGTLWYYRALVDAFLTMGSDSLIEELERTVAEFEHLASCAKTPGENRNA